MDKSVYALKTWLRGVQLNRKTAVTGDRVRAGSKPLKAPVHRVTAFLEKRNDLQELGKNKVDIRTPQET